MVVNVKPLDTCATGNITCIKETPKVIVPRFLEIVTNGFEEHGYATRVYQGTPDDSCSILVSH